MSSLPFDYTIDGLDFEGVIVSTADEKAPTVLVFHGMEGRSDAQVDICHRLADAGYRAVAVDLFGRDVTRGGVDAGAAAMSGFVEDREALRQRLFRVIDILTALPGVDRGATAAIGFCFGGLCVLDLARHGAGLCAVGSFHGLLTPPALTTDVPITTRIAVYHGWDDPYAPPADVVALGTELTQRGADWQLHAFGHTLHAFMAPFANAPERGIAYSETASRRAWASLLDMLGETFAD